MNLRKDPEGRIWKLLHEPDPSPNETAAEPSGPSQPASGQGPPTKLGKYLLRSELGQGASAVVYEAEDTALGRRVALKVLKPHASIGVAATRFHREAMIAARLDHPHIVRIHEHDVVEDSAGRSHHYIAMDFVEGRTLSDILRDGKETPEVLLKLLMEVARAAGHAHARGVVHRDLKPGNVMVDRAGRARLADFGLARTEMFDTRLTQSQAVLGTPMYMAPEQVQGISKDITPRTDVYALGTILYETLTGRAPHEGASLAEIYAAILHEEPATPRKIRRETSRELEAVALKAMDKVPARRYATGDAFADELDRYLRGEPVQARPVSAVTRVWRKIVRRRLVVIPALAAAALLAVLGGREFRRTNGTSAEIAGVLASAADLEKRDKIELARDQYLLAMGLDGANEAARRGFRRLDDACRARESAREEALKFLELGRPALDRASDYVYSKDVDYGELVRRVDEGQKLIERAIEMAPGLALGQYLLGCAWEAKGWPDRAEACWRKVVESDPKFGPARFRLGRLLLARSFLATLETASGLSEAQRKEAEDQSREAAAEFELAVAEGGSLENEPHRKLAEAMLAYTRRDLDRVRRVAREGLRELDGRRGSEEFHWLDSLAAPSIEERLRILDRALEVRPKFPLALLTRAIFRSGKGDLDGVIADCGQALSIHPRFVEAYVNRGIARMGKGDLDGAIVDFDGALKVKPDLAVAFGNRGLAYLRKGDLDRAIADCTEAVRLDPRSALAYARRAKAYKAKGDLDAAVLDYEVIMKIAPSLAGEAYGSRAGIRLSKGDDLGAIADCDETIRLNPGMPDLYLVRFIRAQARERLGHPGGAAADYAASLQDAPADWRLRPAAEQALRRLRMPE